MTSSENHRIHDAAVQPGEVAVVMVPFPAQGHLNQMLQLASLLSSKGLPVHYIGSSLHNRQAKTRVNVLNPDHISKINFHDLPTRPFVSPPPNPTACIKFPAHLQPSWDASMKLRDPVAAILRGISTGVRRLVIVHDPIVAFIVQDAASIPNAESYEFNCISAFSQFFLRLETMGKPPHIEFEVPEGVPSMEGCYTAGMVNYVMAQFQHLKDSAGCIYNTCRRIEGPYIELMERREIDSKKKKHWAVGPILPAAKLCSLSHSHRRRRHMTLEWLDKQNLKSVMYVAFGSSVTMSEEEINELAEGLERSKQNFIWVLRDADKGDVFAGEVRRAGLPEGFEGRVEGVGLVVRDWAPQVEILAHPATGGFMSHCGWNSCIESITFGVPIAAWPMHSEQPKNSFLVTEILQVGLAVRDWNRRDEVVSSSGIESVVKKLMASEEGKGIRKRAEELGSAVRRATEEGGVSRIELDSFIAHITR